MKFFDFDIENVRQALAAFNRIENLDQLLLFLDRENHVRADRVGKASHIIQLDGGQYLIRVQVLTQLDVLLELLSQTGCQRIVSREGLIAEWRKPQIGLPITILLVKLEDARTLDTFD